VKVVLRTDVPGVGKRGDITEVSDGFARNFLVPQGRAILANSGIEGQAASMRRSRDLKMRVTAEGAETIARKLVPIVFRIEPARALRAGCSVSVTASDIVEAVTVSPHRARPAPTRDRRRHQDARLARGGCAPASGSRVPPHFGSRQLQLTGAAGGDTAGAMV